MRIASSRSVRAASSPPRSRAIGNLPLARSASQLRSSATDPKRKEISVTWVQIQKAEEATWQDYERVAAAIGDTPPPGLLLHAAGEVDGHWQAVSVWESKEAF